MSRPDEIVRLYEAQTRRPDGTVLLHWYVPYGQSLNMEAMFGYGDMAIIGAARVWIREAEDGADWRLIAEQNEAGEIVFELR